MPRVYDCFQFYNEFDVLEIRLAELDPLVDHFVLVEATHTHTGKPKPLHFAENRKRYERYADKIIHVVIDDLPLDDPSHFARDIHQREAILRGLGGAQPDDRILFSDCDEIPKPHLLRKALAFHGLSHRIVAFWCENYFYRLNLRNDEHDHRLGPRLVTMSNLKSPNAVREIQFRFSRKQYLRPLATPMAALRVQKRLGKFLWPTIFWNGAWHFSYMGDLAAVNLKLSTFAHAHEVDQLTDVTFKDHMATFKKRPLAELPVAIQQGRYDHLLA